MRDYQNANTVSVMDVAQHPGMQAAALVTFLPTLAHEFSPATLLAVPAALYYCVITFQAIRKSWKDGHDKGNPPAR